MKKSFRQLLFIIAIIWGGVVTSNAQEFGFRLGSSDGYNSVAIDGVFSAGPLERIHADLELYNGGIGIGALWDFINNPINGEALNWYLGVGPSSYFGKEILFGASAEIGLEYRFDRVPIVLGLDWRPTYWIVERSKFETDFLGVNFRFVFGK